MLNRVMLTIAIAICLGTGTVVAGIVNNSGSSQEDYIAIPFQLLDSEGTPVEAVAGDKYTLVVWYPDGSSAYTVNDVSITTSADVETETFSLGGQTIGLYSYNNEVADIAGSAVNGTYKYTFVAYDSSAQLYSTYSGEFQLYTTADISDTWDSTRYADVVAINGDTDAADNLDAAFDATIDSSAILDLKQLSVLGSANDGVGSSILVREHGAAAGLEIEADSGTCISVKALGSYGDGIYVLGSWGGHGVNIGSGSLGTAMGIYGGSLLSHALVINAHGAGGANAVDISSSTGYGVSILTDVEYCADRPGIHIESGDSAAIVLHGTTPSFDSTDFSADFLREVGRSAWKADTNNTVWNSDSSKFGHWNARRQE